MDLHCTLQMSIRLRVQKQLFLHTLANPLAAPVRAASLKVLTPAPE